MLTRQLAELYSLLYRGLIAPGMKTGIIIIDLERLKQLTLHIAHDLPARGMRFLPAADGLLTTLVSGQTIYRNREAIGALPDKLVRC